MKDFDEQEFIDDLCKAVLNKSFEGGPVRWEDKGSLFSEDVCVKFNSYIDEHIEEIKEFRQKPIEEMQQIVAKLLYKQIEKSIEQPIKADISTTIHK